MRLPELIERYNNGERFEYLFFWKTIEDENGVKSRHPLTQWYISAFSKMGVNFLCAEQYMMALKALVFADDLSFHKIMDESNPYECMKLGREISNFNQSTWDMFKEETVFNGNLLKFQQNEYLKDYLKSTKDKIIVEASPRDRIWGIGMEEGDAGIEDPNNWKGENLLGFILMDVRDYLLTEIK